MIFVYILIILIVSFVWAFLTTKKDFGKPREIKKAKASLAREKILFKR
ncbi:MAG TPA: hypothetical protein VHE53_01005 [Patescibacteria group bacterium]|nr:hypothetical protein [Patescibacteria group bacterium]